MMNSSSVTEFKKVLGTPTLDKILYSGSLGSLEGRKRCVSNIPSHLTGIIWKPCIYTVVTIIQVISAMRGLFSQQSSRRKIEAFVNVLNLALIVTITPLAEVVLLTRAIFGIVHPRAYYKPYILLPLKELADNNAGLTGGERVELTFFFNDLCHKKGFYEQLKYVSLIEGILYQIIEKFRATKRDGTPLVDEYRKLLVLKALADASRNCKPRWLEEAYYQFQLLNEPAELSKRIPYYKNQLIEELLYMFSGGIRLKANKSDINEIHIGGTHINDVNGFRKLFGKELGINYSNAHLDPYAKEVKEVDYQEVKRKNLHDFLCHVLTERKFVQEIMARVNVDHNIDLRMNLLTKLATIPEVISKAEELAEDIHDHVWTYVMNKNKGEGKDPERRLTETAIRMLLRDELEYFQQLRTDYI